MAAIHAEDGAHDFRATGTHKSGHTQNLALAQSEVNILEKARLLKVLDLQHYLTGLIATGRVELCNRATNHIVHDLFPTIVGYGFCIHRNAIAHNGHGIALAEHLFHAVGNIDHGHATLFQGTHYLKKLVGFALGQGCGGFVHDDHLSIHQKIAHDFRHLLLAHAALPCFRIKGEFNGNFLTFCFGYLAHFLKIQHAPRIGYTVHHEKIFQNGQVRPNIQLLMDKGNTCRFGLQRIFKADLLAIYENLALVLLVNTGEDIHQRGLAGAVFAHQRMDLTTF